MWLFSRYALALATGVVALAATQRPDAEARVQAAAIDSLFVTDSTRMVVVGDSTIAGGSHFVDEDYRSALVGLGKLPPGLREDFERKRAALRRVDSLPIRVPMRRFTAEELRAVRAIRDIRGYWGSLRKKFPGYSGLLFLSRVGFSSDGKSALMHVEYGCGELCGGTLYILLEQRANGWHVLKVAQPRIS